MPATAAKPAAPAIQSLRKPDALPNSISSKRTPPDHVQRQKHDQTPFGELEQAVVSEAKKVLERGSSLERAPERPEVQRQERSQGEAGQAVHQERPIRRVGARAVVVAPPHATTA